MALIFYILMFSESCIFARLSARKICDLWRNNTYIIKTDNPIVDAQKCAKFGRIWARTLSTEWLNAITKMEIKMQNVEPKQFLRGKTVFLAICLGWKKILPHQQIELSVILLRLNEAHQLMAKGR